MLRVLEAVVELYSKPTSKRRVSIDGQNSATQPNLVSRAKILNAYVAVTDPNWFRFLQSRRELDEINFWRPGGDRQFAALAAGEPFLFKVPSPRNYIVGGGFFSRFFRLPISLAWSAFEEANGAPSFAGLRRAIERHRKSTSPGRDFRIGCVILQRPVLLPELEWIEVQPRLSRSRRTTGSVLAVAFETNSKTANPTTPSRATKYLCQMTRKRDQTGTSSSGMQIPNSAARHVLEIGASPAGAGTRTRTPCGGGF